MECGTKTRPLYTRSGKQKSVSQELVGQAHSLDNMEDAPG